MRRNVVNNSARIEQTTLALRENGPAQRRRKKKITTSFLGLYRESAMPSREKFAECLAHLEAENFDLRHRAVELALQIQALGERIAR